MSKKGFAPIIIVLIIALLAAGGITSYLFIKNRQPKIIGGEKDSHGCLIAAGYSWCEAKQKCLRTWEESCDETTITTSTTTTTEMFKCGDSVTFTYKGSVVTYGTVESQSECWMDRNLGALKVADAYNDSDAYGDLFQWGRGDDGHQDPNSGITHNVSILDEPGHSNFIYNFELDPDQYGDPVAVENPDWRDPPNDKLWQGEGGINNPCPLGWHVPTKEEWENEISGWIYQNNTGGIASPLKLPSVGFRGYFRSVLAQMGGYGAYWSQTVCGKNAYMFLLLSDRYESNCYSRCWGFSIRCIKD